MFFAALCLSNVAIFHEPEVDRNFYSGKMRQVEHTFSNSPHSQRERIFHPVGFVETRGDGGRSMGYAGASKMLRMRGEHLWHSWVWNRKSL